MKNKLNSIRLFKGTLLLEDERNTLSDANKAEMVGRALVRGIEIEPEVFAGCSLAEAQLLVDELISAYGVDLLKLNSTFYKTFQETRDTPELLRRLYQAIHYASTYGGIEELRNSGEIFEPTVINADNWDDMVKFVKSFIKIKAFSMDTMKDKVTSLVSSGMALDEESVEFLFVFISDNWAVFNLDSDYIEKIKNRELLARLALEHGVTPRNFDELMRVIFLATIGTTSVINNNKSKVLFRLAEEDKIDMGASLFELYVDNFGENEASKHVTRYRDFIMLLKLNRNKTMINRVLKLSKKRYVARKVDPLSTITNNGTTLDEVEEILSSSYERGTLGIYRLIRLINAARKMLAAGDKSFQDVIKIRNGKLHVRDSRKLSSNEQQLLKEKEQLLTSYISKLIGDRVEGKVFVFDETFVPAAPTSGKSFVGFLPENSYFKLGAERGVVGVAWSQSRDLDLHATSITGSYGWNSSDAGGGVTYTGDMTRLNPVGFAAEFYESTLPEGELLNISVSPYSFSGPYQLVVASGAAVRDDVREASGVVNAIDDIVYIDSRVSNGDDTERLFSLIKIDGIHRAVVLGGSSIGNHVVSHVKARATIDSMNRSFKSLLTMQELLTFAGAEVYIGKDTKNSAVIAHLDERDSPLLESEDEIKLVNMQAKNITMELFTSIFNQSESE